MHQRQHAERPAHKGRVRSGTQKEKRKKPDKTKRTKQNGPPDETMRHTCKKCSHSKKQHSKNKTRPSASKESTLQTALNRTASGGSPYEVARFTVKVIACLFQLVASVFTGVVFPAASSALGEVLKSELQELLKWLGLMS